MIINILNEHFFVRNFAIVAEKFMKFIMHDESMGRQWRFI